MQTRSFSEGAITNRRGDHQSEVLAWTPSIVLDKAPLPRNASIRDFEQGRARYVANAVEQALLLLVDMADLRSMRKHEVFLSLKRDLAMASPLTIFLTFNIITFFSFFFNYLLYLFPWQAIQAVYRVEEMVNSSHRQMKEEEGRCIAVVDAFNVTDRKI